jgi:hypothetical protein
MTKKIPVTLLEIRQMMRAKKDKSWLFTQSKAKGVNNFTPDPEVKDRWWNGDWPGLPLDMDFIAYWAKRDQLLHVGHKSSENLKCFEVDNKNGKPMKRYKIPMDSVITYSVDTKDIELQSFFAEILKPGVIGNIYSYWPNNSKEYQAAGFNRLVADDVHRNSLRNKVGVDEILTDVEYKNVKGAISKIKVDPDIKNEILREVWCRSPAYAEYRKELVRFWDGKCALTNIRVDALLVASHIRPWSHCKDEHEKDKINVNNGLLLISPIDKLFDRGYITFNDDGVLQLHKNPHRRYLSDKSLSAFGLTRKITNELREVLNAEQKVFMRHHEKYVCYRL